MRLFRRTPKRRADPARIAELERELGIGQPETIDVRMEDVVVRTHSNGSREVSSDLKTWTPYPERDEYRKVLCDAFRGSTNPALREAAWDQLEVLNKVETVEQPDPTFQQGLLWLMASAEGLRSSSNRS